MILGSGRADVYYLAYDAACRSVKSLEMISWNEGAFTAAGKSSSIQDVVFTFTLVDLLLFCFILEFVVRDDLHLRCLSSQAFLSLEVSDMWNNQAKR